MKYASALDEQDIRLVLLTGLSPDKKLESILAITDRAIANALKAEPVNMLLYCPNCGEQHIDQEQPEKSWSNPPHRSHECQCCNWVWRPADTPTNGVAFIQTKGQRDQKPSPRYYATAKDFIDATKPEPDLLANRLEWLKWYRAKHNASYKAALEAEQARKAELAK